MCNPQDAGKTFSNESCVLKGADAFAIFTGNARKDKVHCCVSIIAFFVALL